MAAAKHPTTLGDGLPDGPPPVPLVALPAEDAERIYNYLLSRPFAEVEALIPALRQAQTVVIT